MSKEISIQLNEGELFTITRELFYKMIQYERNGIEFGEVQRIRTLLKKKLMPVFERTKLGNKISKELKDLY